MASDPHSAVREAILAGKLSPLGDCVCTGCGVPARLYHHHAGYEREHWLTVTPMCHSCHRRAHVLTHSPVQATSVQLPRDLVEWLRDDAVTNGRTVSQSIRWYLTRAREEA